MNNRTRLFENSLNDNLLLTHINKYPRRAQSKIVVACMPAMNEVTHLVISGEMDVDTAKQVRSHFVPFFYFIIPLPYLSLSLFLQAIDLCLDGCGQLYAMMRNCLLKGASKKKPTPV